ncbi:DUF5713 family protein [Streptomyces sp. DSM 116494]|uniref:DUF5713 family protein n=1 Tax=Streptomyces okerensis TaxID=3344655 RepID=UPI00388DB9CD
MPVGDERVAASPFPQALCRDGCFPDRWWTAPGTSCPPRASASGPPAAPTLAGRPAPTHAATVESNGLPARFEAAGSEIETVAREETDGGVRFITRSYGVVDAGVEEPIAPATVSRPGPGGHGSAPAGRIAGRGGVRGGSGQLSDASVSFQVVDGRMIAAARAGSGW